MIKYQTTQLTDNNLVDSTPQISGNNIVWVGNDGNDDEIFFYDGTKIVQLTDNNTFDFTPAISGNNLVWSRSSSNPLTNPLLNGSILFYDGSTTIELATVDGILNAGISGNNVVWGDWGDILSPKTFFYDGSNTIQLGDLTVPVFLPGSVSGDNVVWTGNESNNTDDGDIEVFLYNGNSTRKITENNLLESTPLTSGDNIAWTGFNASGDENSTEVFFYDGNTTTQLTDNNFSDLLTSISGNNIVWVGNDGNDNEIFFYDGNTTTQLTDNETDDTNSIISGDNIVWAGNDGNDYEIFLYDGNTTTQLTNNEIDDLTPNISGNNVVWEADDEIFLATPSIVNNEPISNTEIKLYRFRNKAFDTGTYLFVGETEGNSILANPDLSQNFELEGVLEDGTTNSAFVASLEPREDLIPFYRLRSLDILGTYLFVSQEEYDTIFAADSAQKDKWEKEGFSGDGNDIAEFYLLDSIANQGIQFNRFQNNQNNTFLYAGEEETAAILNNPNLANIFTNQGGAFESFV